MNASDLLARFGRLDSAAVSDALDALGLPPGIGGIRPLWGPAAVVGRAVTVGLEPRGDGPAGAHIGTTAVEAAGPDSIIVIDNQGREDVSCWGGILSLGASRQGVRAVVADGVCRDVGEARELGLPVFSRGAIPATARGRLQQRSIGEPVQLAGRTVHPGDLVVADETGIAVVPAERAEEVLEIAEGVVAREQAIAEEVRRGVPISEAMHDARLAGTGAPVDATGLTTAAVSDALDSLGLPGSLHGISPLRPGQRGAGRAFTVAYEPVDADGGTVGDFLDDVPAGAMVVIDNAARTDCTVWGGIMSRIARDRGIAGTVIAGTCRDTATAAEVGYPLWSVSSFMRTGKDRVRVRAVQEPVEIDGVLLRPDDVVLADDDGVVVVPTERWEEVARIARGIEQAEDAIVEAAAAGISLRDARAAHGYHRLQTRGRR